MDVILYFFRDKIVGIHYFIYAFVCLFLMFSINQVSLPKTENNFLNIVSAEETTEVDGDTKLTESDWKIELDENAKGGTKEFDFIQRN